jgi:hypothetical protein
VCKPLLILWPWVCFPVGLEHVTGNAKAQAFQAVGSIKFPKPLLLPYAKLATTMLASPPRNGITYEDAVGPVLEDPCLRLPEPADRAEVVRQLTAANLLMTLPRPYLLNEDPRCELNFCRIAGSSVQRYRAWR